MKILNLGSLNIDYVYDVDHMVAKGETLTAKHFHQFPGGKGLNQSVAMKKAGLEVWHAGAIGKEGTFLIDYLEQNGVHTDLVEVRSDVPTGHAIIQKDSAGDNCIVLFGGANREITEEQIDQTLAFFQKGDILVIQNEVNGLRYLIEQAYQRQMTVFFNMAPMEDDIKELPLECIEYLFLNEIEAGQLLGVSSEEEQSLVEGLMNQFSSCHIILTLGAKGAYYIHGKDVIKQNVIKADVVDTTAAGDTFMGYFIAALVKEYEPEKAMELASRASAVTISRAGAAVSIPTWDELL